MARVLLIEADSPLAKNISQALNKAGHKVEWLVDAQVAINAADKHQPDIVVMDLLLANRSGVEFLYEFRSYPEWSKIPVVILSGLTEHELADSSVLQHLGIYEYLYKPNTSLSDIIEVVEQLINR